MTVIRQPEKGIVKAEAGIDWLIDQYFHVFDAADCLALYFACSVARLSLPKGRAQAISEFKERPYSAGAKGSRR